MTDEEVQQIYDYLHDNYKYKDGCLIRYKEIHGSKIGRSSGCLKIHPGGNAYLVSSFNINKKNYNKRLSHLIYLYHNKKFPKYIHYLDGNKTNTKIENLKDSRIRQDKKISLNPGKNKDSLFYRPGLILEGKQLSFGTYQDKNQARKAIDIAKKLIIETDLSPIEIKEKVRKLMHKTIKDKKIKRLPVGVTYDKNRYRSDIRINGKKIYLGGFNTSEEAHQAYLKAKEQKK